MAHGRMSAALVLVVGILAGAPGLQGDRSRVRDTDLGLSKTSVFDSPAPPATRTNATEPGERAPVAPRYPEQPPVIPHGIEELLPITLEENACVDCHAAEKTEEGDPTPIPESHYIDLRNAAGRTGDAIVGARYNCASCHVSPGDNPPLVNNVFGK